MKSYLIPLLGLFFGFLNGKISVHFLARYIKSTNKKFFTVFGLLLFYKFVFLVVSVWLIRYEKVIIILLYCLVLIFVQTIVIFNFFRNYGIKRDT